MRATSDDWGQFCATIEMTIQLEQWMGVAISDAELEGVHTLRELSRVVQGKLPPGSGREARAIELVSQAAKTVPWYSATEPELDISMMDAIDPDRWNRGSE